MKRQNKIWTWLLTGIISTGIFSCSSQLDLEPEQSVSSDEVFTSGSTALSALYGVYSRAQRLEVCGGQAMAIGDFMADNSHYVGALLLYEIENFSASPGSGIISEIWRIHYDAIMGANNIIKKVPGIVDPAFSDADRRMYVAEARFMRAMLYFQLVNLYAQPYQAAQGSSPGLPLVTEPFEGNVLFPGRATVNEVHAQIEKDLLEALPDLADTFSDPALARGRATRGAANALLSRLYLYREVWDKAASYAKAVIDAPYYKLAEDYAFYDGNTREDVFSIQQSQTDNPQTGSGSLATYYRPVSAGGRGDCPFSESLVQAFEQEAGDKRYLMSDMGTTANGETRRFPLKYPDVATSKDNIPMIRVTEMYLNLAEALAVSEGVNGESVNMVNLLRGRAGLTGWNTGDFNNGDELRTAILNERRKELCFEGHRRMDLLRSGQSLRNNDPAKKAGADMVILPIPQREIDLSPALKGHQNPGYN